MKFQPSTHPLTHASHPQILQLDTLFAAVVVLVTQATAATLIFETEGFIDANYLMSKALFETTCLGLQIKNYSADLETKHFRSILVQ